MKIRTLAWLLEMIRKRRYSAKFSIPGVWGFVIVRNGKLKLYRDLNE